MIKEDENIEQALNKAIECIKDKKGENISVMKFSAEQTAICDYFIICEANNNLQAQAISDHIQRTLRNEIKIRPGHIEGYQHAKWILIDYFDIIIHIFLPEARNFYSLEKLWADAEVTNIN